MRTKHVTVLPYDTNWKNNFLEIKFELEKALSGIAVRYEHVGSTSVEGLAAKPIIDIDIVIRDSSDLSKAIGALASIGYVHEGDLGIKGRDAFSYEGKEHLQAHHLYVCSEDSAELERHITFREYLKTHPDAALDYGNIKIKAAELFPEDIDSYIEYKSPIINQIYKEMFRLKD